MTSKARFKKRLYFSIASYFRFFANFALRRWHPRIIAITGSVGKTTMLHLLEFELGEKAHYSHNANSAFGVSFDLLGLRGVTGSKLYWLYLFIAAPIKAIYFKHRQPFYVVEIDAERPKEAEFLAAWLKPEITLWVSLGRSHAVQFDQQVQDGTFPNLDSAIAHEFAMLPRHTTKRIYINSDINLIKATVSELKKRHNLPAEVVNCSKSELTKYTVHPNHTEFTFHKTVFTFSDPMPKDVALQLVMLKHLTKYLEIPLKTDLSKLTLPPGRNSFFEGKNGLKLIDSSYNAHLISMASILSMARDIRSTHKWLVIGDMVEQGSIEQEEHQKLAALIIKVKPEQVVLVGHRTAEYTAPLLKTAKVKHFTTNSPKEALRFIERHTAGDETIIFKGSQYLEWIIEKLLKDPSDAARLPRREKAAQARRNKRGLK